jgi:hypothetical protein
VLRVLTAFSPVVAGKAGAPQARYVDDILAEVQDDHRIRKRAALMLGSLKNHTVEAALLSATEGQKTFIDKSHHSVGSIPTISVAS